MKFADVKNDIAFRKIFGNENRTESLISFLNSILGFQGDERIESVTILDPYQLPKLKGGKVSVLDVRATDHKNRQFIVAVAKQLLNTESIINEREEMQVAEQYRELKPAYFVGILCDFSHTSNPHYISRNRVLDIDTGEVTIKDIEFNFIELLKFNKPLEALETLVDKWIFFIKNAENLTLVPRNIDDEGLLSAYEEANQHTWTQAELDAYDYVDMRTEQARAEVDAAVARGELKGKLEGKIEGKIEGKLEGKLETARAMKKDGESIEKIKRYTGLSDEEIKSL